MSVVCTCSNCPDLFIKEDYHTSLSHLCDICFRKAFSPSSSLWNDLWDHFDVGVDIDIKENPNILEDPMLSFDDTTQSSYEEGKEHPLLSPIANKRRRDEEITTPQQKIPRKNPLTPVKKQGLRTRPQDLGTIAQNLFPCEEEYEKSTLPSPKWTGEEYEESTLTPL